MSSMSQDPNTQQMYELIMKYFDMNDLRDIYFSLGIDWEAVPQPANKPQYVWHLLRFTGSNQDQDLLLSKLRKLRPRLFWPQTFSVPVTTHSTVNPGNISIGTFIGRQNVNINLPSKTPSQKTTNRRRSKVSNPSKTSQVESELLNIIFASTKLYVFMAIILFLLLPLSASIWMLLNEQIWQDNDFMLILFFGALTVVMYVLPFKIIFRFIYGKISRHTSFYELNVSTRQRVKGKLLNHNWGNSFWNFACKLFIGIFLQSDKNKANKMSKLKI